MPRTNRNCNRQRGKLCAGKGKIFPSGQVGTISQATNTEQKNRFEKLIRPTKILLFGWGILHEEDWPTEIPFAKNFSVHILPSQHYSGRFTTPNNTPWCGFAFVTPNRRVFCSGDGGYGSHFKEIGNRFGGFDLAFMENGQYNEKWQRIHLLPEHTTQACVDVGAKQVTTSHRGKFALALHPWEQPYLDMTAVSKAKPYEWLIPRLREIAYIGKAGQIFAPWWEEILK